MAKKPRRRRRFSLRGVRITPELALSTLASDTALASGLTGNGDAPYRCMSIKQVWTLSGLTAGEGPVTVGFAHSDYTVTEIKECLEAQASVSAGNMVVREQADRKVRVVGVLGPEANSQLNDGKPISTKLNWLIPVGIEVRMFAFNESTASLTTGAVLNGVGRMWVQDRA